MILTSIYVNLSSIYDNLFSTTDQHGLNEFSWWLAFESREAFR